MKTSWLLLSIIVCFSKATIQSTSVNSTCDLKNQFDCGTECIPKAWECDNMKDCHDGADEADCEPNDCSEGQILCEHGGCVSDAFKCDGHRDCYDGSDENYCGPISYRFSENSSFNFEDPNHYKNEGGYDKNGCLPGFGLCDNEKLCIPNRSFCDGTDDCMYGSDEKNCTRGGPGDIYSKIFAKAFKNPCNHMFACRRVNYGDDKEERVCINQTDVCNGKKDCPLGDDESEDCSQCSSAHCEHQCENTPYGARCVCKQGFKLQSDDVSCVEIDECALPERACHHFCENTIGSFRCSCAEGYHLKADEKTCELTTKPEGSLLLREYGTISKRSLEDFTETNFTMIYERPRDRFIRAFDYSRRDNKFFMFIGERTVQAEQLVVQQNGTLRTLREYSSTKIHEHLVVDWIGNNLFFQEFEGYEIEGERFYNFFISVCTMDGRFYRQIIQSKKDIYIKGLAIHPMRGLLFWNESPLIEDQANSKKGYPYRIMMANMDGSEVQPLVRSKLKLRSVFAIDHVHHDIYYESKDYRIRRVNIDTRKTDVVASNPHSYSSTMTYHNGYLYLTSSREQLRVLEVAKKGARVHRVLQKERSSIIPHHIVVNDTLHQVEPSAGNPCKELDCPWICVIVPDFTAKCLCPYGYTPSGTTCVPPSTETGEHENLIGLELMSEYCKTGVGCLNGGTCREVSNKTRIVCDCVEPYDGLYCERRKPVLSDNTVLL
ncbi:unnamed protein product [Caenorhabditis brenneri]